MSDLAAFEARREDERQEAARALLTGHLLPVEHPAFPLVRRHAEQLKRDFGELLGYKLQVSADYARLYKRIDPERARALPMPPVTKSERQHDSIDDRKVLDRARIVHVMLTCAALERTSTRQIPIGELADRVGRTAAGLGVEVDWGTASGRGLLTDAIEWLVSLGVLVEHAGSTDAFKRQDDSNEALYNINRKRLAALLDDPLRALSAATVQELAADAHLYAATEEGENQRIRHRLARRLAEDPVLYLDELTERERTYFYSQRARLEGGISALLGVQSERRAEGSAMVVRERELTDRPFPARSNRKQIALLLCRPLAEEPSARLTRSAVAEQVRELIAHHGERWNLSADRADDVEHATSSALALLADLDLVRCEQGDVIVRPALQRFRDPRTTTPEERA